MRAAVLLLVVCLAGAGRAFDTGFHEDLTRNSLKHHGFKKNAIDVAVLSNWLTDYHSWVKQTPGSPNLKRLHFDTLPNAQRIVHQWQLYAYHGKTAFEAAQASGDALRGVLLLGAGLHGMQDFYTHTDWVEMHPRGVNGVGTCTCFRDDTVTSYTKQQMLDMDDYLFSGEDPFTDTDREGRRYTGEAGSHGTYCSGVNHDSYDRPNFQEAVAFGYVGSCEYVEAARLWVNDTVYWEKLKSYGDDFTSAQLEDVQHELTFMHELSSSAKLPNNGNGHYKGSGSGDAEKTAESLVTYEGKGNTWLAEAFHTAADPPGYINILGQDMYNFDKTDIPDVWPPFPSYRPQDTAVLLRTLAAATPDPDGKFAFSVVTINSQEVTDSAQHADKPQDKARWTNIVFVPKGATVPIRYTLHVGDGHIRGTTVAEADLTFNTVTNELSGDVTGKHDEVASAYALSGSKGDATFYVTTAGFCIPDAAPAAVAVPDVEQTTKWQCVETPIVPYCLLSSLEQKASFLEDIWKEIVVVFVVVVVVLACCCLGGYIALKRTRWKPKEAEAAAPEQGLGKKAPTEGASTEEHDEPSEAATSQET